VNDIRTERSFGVTAQLTPDDRRALFVLRQSEGWPVLLDVLEMVCIETETDLINTPAEQEAAILAKHKMSKAAWQLFTHLQEKVEDEVSRYVSGVVQRPPEPLMTDAEREVENILNPMNYPPQLDDVRGQQEL
jgi:hypothetical protein